MGHYSILKLRIRKQLPGQWQWFEPENPIFDNETLTFSKAGFPFYQLDRFLKILVQDLQEFVAVSEEFANNAVGTVKSGGLLFDRRVTRTITPGTLIDEKFMDPYENNFLLAISALDSQEIPSEANSLEVPTEYRQELSPVSGVSQTLGLAWLDLSTGDFFTQTATSGALPSAVARIGAKEIVIGGSSQDQASTDITSLLKYSRHSITYHAADTQQSSIVSWTPMLDAEINPSQAEQFTVEEIRAGSLLLSYVRDRIQNSDLKLQPPIRRLGKDSMSIDKNSIRALEVLGTSREGLGGGKGSLFHTIRKTVTKSGSRLLRDWISSPSMSIPTINNRFDLVSTLLGDRVLREELVRLLRQSYDSQRLVQKFSMGRGDADDLVSLSKTIDVTNTIVRLLWEYENTQLGRQGKSTPESASMAQSLKALSARVSLEGPDALAMLIWETIDEEGLLESHRDEDDSGADLVAMAQNVLHTEGSEEDLSAMSRVTRIKPKARSVVEPETEDIESWVLRKTASPVLTQLHQSLSTLRQEKQTLTSRLRGDLAAQSLTLRWTPGLGYICHVRGTKDVSASMKNSTTGREAKTTKSTRSFHHSEWSSLGNRIDQAKLRIKAEEQRVLQNLRTQVVANLVKLRRNATVLDELDIGCSFAKLAEEQNFVRPILNDSMTHSIVGGRHPTVKQGLEEQGRLFVSNDCHLGEKERIWLITGPNMAGKSTFLRQNALISILAQVGSFVPAEHAEIGLVDQIFTRVGSADNLFKDQSTFMVEMMETATILNKATPQSFVIMDEIGRGTTPEDGIAVGFACLHHLYHKNHCRTLFATHFHSLADMTNHFDHLGCYCTDVAEGPGESFTFVHRLRRGVNRSSHALKVARLAGTEAIRSATLLC